MRDIKVNQQKIFVNFVGCFSCFNSFIYLKQPGLSIYIFFRTFGRVYLDYVLTGLKSTILTVFKPNTKSFLAKVEGKRKKKQTKISS